MVITVDEDDIKIKRNQIYEDVKSLCWEYGMYKNYALYDKITDMILKKYISAAVKRGDIKVKKKCEKE